MGKDGDIHCGRNVKWPASLVKLSDIISDGLKNAGYKQKDCQSISRVVIKSLSFRAGRRTFCIPTGKVLERFVRGRQLFQEFDGTNLDDLSRKHGIRRRDVYAIIGLQRTIASSELDAILRCYEAVSGIACTAPEVAQQADEQNRGGE